MRLALPVPSPAEGLAEAALEDVENLRLLILRRLLPSRDTEPEDDLTPTPSVIGGTHTWDSVLSSQDSASQEVLAEPPSAAEEPKSRSGWEEQSETGPTVSAEEQSSYKVVRKGNYFYVSMPAGPPEPVLPPGPPQAYPPEEPPRPSAAEGPPDPPGPLRDVDLIFRTIEQLTLKLNRLKAVEAAHRELLRSLGHSSSADTTPVGLPAPGMEGWSQRPHSPEGDSPLTRSLRSLQGHSTNIPGCRAPLAEDPAHTADL